jgi:hypothetical protein
MAVPPPRYGTHECSVGRVQNILILKRMVHIVATVLERVTVL